MKILILEDNDARIVHFRRVTMQHTVEIVKTAKEAIQKLGDGAWDLVSLDHDLGGKEMVGSGEGTGWEVAKWLSDHPEKKPPYIILHSFNVPGRANMAALLPEALEEPGWWGKGL